MDNIIQKIKFRSNKKSFTKFLINRYCNGSGIEIGPGEKPYGNVKTTLFQDKFDTYRSKIKKMDIISDASSIPKPSNSFDFLISAHCLEHCPNTLQVLTEWKRVLKQKGILFLILPHVERTFDNGRTISSLEHHIKDFNNKVDFKDQTHWKEYQKHSLSKGNHPWLKDVTKSD